MQNLNSVTTISATQFVRQCKDVLNALPTVGEVVIARHKTEIARLIPVKSKAQSVMLTAAQIADDHYGHTPDADGSWARDVRSARSADSVRNPWAA
jgi:antitoxin (DNA-binding transcriptional repressor) of toxin-antitoxin stability system